MHVKNLLYEPSKKSSFFQQLSFNETIKDTKLYNMHYKHVDKKIHVSLDDNQQAKQSKLSK